MPSRRIKLAYLITDLEAGGVPLHLYRLATRLPADRFQVTVISLAAEGPVGDMLRRAGLAVRSCGARRATDLVALWRLWRFLRADPPDILHAMLFHANLAARLVALPAGLSPRRVLCEIQTVERERRWHLVLDNLTCRWCRCEIGNSPSVIEHLHRRAHVPRSRLHAEMGAVDVSAIAAAPPVVRSELGLDPAEAVVLWTGRLDPVKGFEEMLAAFALVCRRRPARLLLVGEGEYRSRVEQLVRRYDLADRVCLMGFRADVPRLLKAADLFLFCSRTEGLPNAVLEAMAAGLPIVATRVPGCVDVIEDGRTGRLVAAGSADEIARAVLEVLDGPDRAAEWGRRAQEWVRRHADVHEWTRRWMTFYTRLLERKETVHATVHGFAGADAWRRRLAGTV